MGGRGSSFHGSGGGAAQPQTEAPVAAAFDTSDYLVISDKDTSDQMMNEMAAQMNVASGDMMKIQNSAWNSVKYVGSSCSFEINKALYLNPDKDINEIPILKDDFKTKEHKESALAVDRATRENTISKNVVLFRAVSSPAAAGLSRATYNKIVNGTDRERAEAINSIIGSQLTSQSFMSTSISESRNIFKGYPIHRKIYAPSGSKGFVTNNKMESEVILPRKTQTEVFKVEYSGDKLILHERIISQP